MESSNFTNPLENVSGLGDLLRSIPEIKSCFSQLIEAVQSAQRITVGFNNPLMVQDINGTRYFSVDTSQLLPLSYQNSPNQSVYPNFTQNNFALLIVNGPNLTLVNNGDGTATLSLSQLSASGGSSSGSIKVSVVTDIQCINGNLVVTKSCLTIPGGSVVTGSC
jgi:hypothetical protein